MLQSEVMCSALENVSKTEVELSKTDADSILPDGAKHKSMCLLPDVHLKNYSIVKLQI